MTRLLNLCLLLTLIVSVPVIACAGTPQPEIMGISLGMSRADARARLQTVGSLERETRKRQEVWTVKDARISHLLVGYDPDMRVRYVTAIARTDGPRMRYADVADLQSAQREQNQGNYKLTWQIAAASGDSAYLVIAHGRDPQYLESYSVKKIDQKKIE